MKDEIKMLMSFVTAEKPKILVTDCEFLKEIEEIRSEGDVKCTRRDCENGDDCIQLRDDVPFLPPGRFDVWVIDTSKVGFNLGYVFYLASMTLKNLGILAIKGSDDDALALGYGFQILHHGDWHYYLKAYEKKFDPADFDFP